MASEAERLITIDMLRESGVLPGDTVLVAFSGGADSTALLLSMAEHLRLGAFKALCAAHLDHGIRIESAARDRAFCAALCEKVGVAFVSERIDVPAFAKANGLSLETAAREVRYAFLERVRVSQNADCILTAHHARDQAETVLMHLLRGSGLAGLCGMRARVGRIARPMLTRTRDEIEAYLARCGASYCVDETNASADAFRNRVRNELLPALEKASPRAAEALCRTAALCQTDEAYLSAIAEETTLRLRQDDGGFLREALLLEHAAIRTRILKRALLETADGDVTRADIERVSALCGAQTGTRIELSGGRSAYVDAERLYIGQYPSAQSFAVPLSLSGETITPAGRFFAETLDAYRAPESAYEAYLDRDALPNELTARTRRDGDRFFPLGAPGARKLKDVLIDRKIPRFRRDIPLICAGNEVYFAVGLTISEYARVKPTTKHILHITFREGLGS